MVLHPRRILRQNCSFTLCYLLGRKNRSIPVCKINCIDRKWCFDRIQINWLWCSLYCKIDREISCFCRNFFSGLECKTVRTITSNGSLSDVFIVIIRSLFIFIYQQCCLLAGEFWCNFSFYRTHRTGIIFFTFYFCLVTVNRSCFHLPGIGIWNCSCLPSWPVPPFIIVIGIIFPTVSVTPFCVGSCRNIGRAF